MRVKFLFLFLVFITEWAVLMLEMAAFRMFVPFFGSDLYVWGNIIGIVMVGSSLGYYAGGKLGDAYPRAKVLIYLVAVCGLFILIIPWLSPFLLAVLSLISYPLLASFLYGMIIIGIPAFFIELAPPFVIRLQNKTLATTGSTTGSVYGVSTVGGVLGIMIASFVTLPWLGVNATIWLAGIVLLVAAAMCLLYISRPQLTL